ncbi:hypothetical protein GCM10011507_07310 [Edaphobacter acidisoli]|uniref:Uncharacterized protein n=1 Tax=Edaphobacter acidisoli TaxID=2040573 RepID=A0A916RJ88_9BACT|nr:hypothetical protein GCM10011507_07310 [Edaphobacter acidisoli]
MNHLNTVACVQLRIGPSGTRHDLAVQLHGNAVALQAELLDQFFNPRGPGESFKAARLTIQNHCKRHTLSA